MKGLSEKSKLFIRLIISATFIVLLLFFGKFDFQMSWNAAMSADCANLWISFILYQVLRFFLAARWFVLTEIVGFREKYIRILQITYAGLFFNSFFPSMVGGDLARCYYLRSGKRVDSNSGTIEAFSSLVVDRVIGLATLLLFACAGFLVSKQASEVPPSIRTAVFLLTAALLIGFPLAPRISRSVLGESNWFTRKLDEGRIQSYWSSPGLIIKAILYSLMVQVVSVASHVYLGFSIGLSLDAIPISSYLVLYSVVSAVAMLTPSINGVGVREWGYTLLLGELGADSSIALTYSVLWLAISVASSLLGGIVYLTMGARVPISDVAAPEG